MQNFQVFASDVKDHVEIRVPGKGIYLFPADENTINRVKNKKDNTTYANYEDIVNFGTRVQRNRNYFHRTQNKKIRTWAMSERNAHAMGGFKNTDLKDYYNLAA